VGEGVGEEGVVAVAAYVEPLEGEVFDHEVLGDQSELPGQLR
jgi:predicted RNA-binding protein